MDEFGFDMKGEIEVMDFSWNHEKTMRRYEVYFAVSGELTKDALPLHSDAAQVTLYQADSPDLMYDVTRMPKPHFFIHLSAELPWVLPQAPED